MDWEKTKVWSEGGYYARVFFNVKGREPQGTIEPADYESFRDEMKAKFEATVDRDGQPMGTLVFKPEEIYQRGQERRPRPDRPLRRPVLAVDRRRRLSDDPRPGERHRPGRLQPRPVRGVRPGGVEQPAPGRGRGRPPARHRADPDGTGRLRDPRGDAGPFAGRRRAVTRRRRLRPRRRGPSSATG